MVQAINIEDLGNVLDVMTEQTDSGLAENSISLADGGRVDFDNPEEGTPALCKIQQKIEKATEFLKSLQEYTNFINSIDYAALLRLENPTLVNNITRKVEILSLKIKKASLIVKLYITKIKKRILVLAGQGKIAQVLQAMFAGIIIAIQLIFKIIAVVIGVIELILTLLPSFLCVAGEGMAFFLTPKSFKPVKMNIMNPNQSDQRILPSPVITAIDAVLNAPIVVMATTKVAGMAASAAKAAAKAKSLLSSGNTQEPCVVYDVPDFTYTIRQKLVKAVELVLALLPLVEPLPKYERLPI